MVLKENPIWKDFTNLGVFLGENNSNYIYLFQYIYHLKMSPLNHVPLKITLLLKLKNYPVMMGKRSQRHPESSNEIELMRVSADPNQKQEEEKDAKFKLQKKLSNSFPESSDEIELLSLNVDPNPEQEEEGEEDLKFKLQKKLPDSIFQKKLMVLLDHTFFCL